MKDCAKKLYYVKEMKPGKSLHIKNKAVLLTKAKDCFVVQHLFDSKPTQDE